MKKIIMILSSEYGLLITYAYVLVRGSIHYLPEIIGILDLPIAYGYELIVTMCSHFFDIDGDTFYKTAIPLEEMDGIKEKISVEETSKSLDTDSNETDPNKTDPNKKKPGIYFNNYELFLLLVSPIAIIICVVMAYK